MLGIVVISYRSDDLTVQFVKDELSKVTIPHRTVIVANGSSPEEAARLQQRLAREADVIASDNGGFARGNNAGACWLRDRIPGLTALLFCNNDIVFKSPDSVQLMLDKLQSIPEAGAIGPEVVGLDRKRQGPEPYIGLWKGYVWIYLSTPFISKAKKRELFGLDYSGLAEEGFHYRLSGCCLMVDASTFFQAGMFDEHTFLYSEENILSERFAALGKGMYFYPDVKVIHLHGATVRKHFRERKRASLQMESLCYYYKQYRGYSGLSVGIARILNGLIHLFV